MSKESSNSSPTSGDKDNGGTLDIRLYVHSDQVLPIHEISNEVMPAVLNHLLKLKSCVPKDQKELSKTVEGIRDDFFKVRQAIGELMEVERLLNLQTKDLVLTDLDDVLIERNAILLDRKRRRKGAAGLKSPEDTVDSSQVDSISLEQILTQVPKLSQVVSAMKEALNLSTPKTEINNEEGSKLSKVESFHPEDSSEAVLGMDSKSLASILNSKISHTSLHSEIQIHYASLDTRLKLCLLCIAAFPDNSVINRRVLMYWWIGESFIDPLHNRENGTSSERTADELVKELMTKGLVEPVRRKQHPIVHTYRMHPFIRYVMITLAKKASFFDIDEAGNFSPKSQVSSRACLVRTEQGSSQHVLEDSANSDPRKLLTLFNVNEPFLHLRSHWFSKLSNVRVLQLGRWQSWAKMHHIEVGNTEFLKNIANMKRLRYISLQGISGIPQLPFSVSSLTYLQILDLRACHNLQEVPEGIGKLQYLTHLDMSECYLIGRMPQELASLSRLQVLKGFLYCL